MLSGIARRTCAFNAVRKPGWALVMGLQCRRHLHEFLLMVNDAKEIQNLALKQTFVGKVMSEDAAKPQMIFACQADSIEAVEKIVFEDEKLDRSAVRIFPLETIHTSALENDNNAKDS